MLRVLSSGALPGSSSRPPSAARGLRTGSVKVIVASFGPVIAAEDIPGASPSATRTVLLSGMRLPAASAMSPEPLYTRLMSGRVSGSRPLRTRTSESESCTPAYPVTARAIRAPLPSFVKPISSKPASDQTVSGPIAVPVTRSVKFTVIRSLAVAVAE